MKDFIGSVLVKKYTNVPEVKQMGKNASRDNIIRLIYVVLH
jgi:hypothetical protein